MESNIENTHWFEEKSLQAGPISLVIVQPTPFCNIDCRYCYLPSRDDTRRMQIATVEALMKRLIESNWVVDRFTMCWHAGEPLTVGRKFYEDAFSAINVINHGRYIIKHTVQTNGLLIDDAWCDLFAAHDVHVGMSIDGPAFLHDLNRVTRTGMGTHARAMESVALLNRRGLRVSVISVITQDTLKHPEEFVDFFAAYNFTEVGINVEEIESVHNSSSLQGLASEYRKFIQTVLSHSSHYPHLTIRELAHMTKFISATSKVVPSTSYPFRHLTVDWEGGFSTFSPELIGSSHPRIGKLVLGNVHLNRLADAMDNPIYKAMWSEIRDGLKRCHITCDYALVCGGGCPSNKLAEHGTFAASETLACQLKVQVLGDVVLTHLESQLANT
jgi:uncharacterized protein